MAGGGAGDWGASSEAGTGASGIAMRRGGPARGTPHGGAGAIAVPMRSPCRRVADALGFDVRHEFVDEGVSGAGPFRDRLGLQELLAATPELDVIVVDRLDRLSRLGSDLKELMQTFERSRIEVWSVADLP